MSDFLLQTKLYAPRARPSLVRRPGLLDQLDGNVDADGRFARNLTLVSAPAGFGKTTLMADWGLRIAESSNRPSERRNPQLCWLSLDESDNEPVRFFSYVIAALQTADGRLGGSALDLLRASPPDQLGPILAGLVNELAASDAPLALVLDDYHLINHSAVHDGIAFLVENTPPTFHLILLSRADPPFSLARLRSHRLMTEIRQKALRFDQAETAQFLNQLADLRLPETAVAALAERTEGWPAGLQMAALSLDGRADPQAFIEAFTGSNRYIFDFLAEEVLARRPSGTRAFLLQTSILDRFCAPLCDAVMGIGEQGLEGSQSAQRILEQLEAANLFLIPLDDERRWYRYHNLFADLLRQQMRREMPEREAMLHGRASRWFEAADYPDEAVHHALAAADHARAAELVAGYSDGLVNRGEINKLLDWIGRLPADWQRRHPQLVLNHAWAMLFRGSAGDVEATLAYMPADVAGSPPYSVYLKVLRGTLAARQGQTAAAVALLETAVAELEALEPDRMALTMRGAAAVILGNSYQMQRAWPRALAAYETAVGFNREVDNLLALLSAVRGWGELLADRGELHEAAAVFEEGLEAERRWAGRLVGGGRRLLVGAPLHVSLAGLLVEWNRLDEAEKHLADAVRLLALSGPVNRSEGLALLVRLRLAQGDADAVPPLLEDLKRLRRQAAGPYARGRLDVVLAVAHCALYRRRPSPDLRAAVERSAAEAADRLARARALLALDRPAEARPLLEGLAAETEEDGRRGVWMAAAVLLCLALEAMGETAAALDWLDRALPVAGPAGYVRLFVDEGERMQRLLETAVRGGNADPYAGSLLAHFPPTADPRTRSLPHLAADGLSPRETEVLQLVAQGLTNKEIAARLFIAPSTAKRHTINIYNKLGVNNRAEATARGYELGLVVGE